MKRIYIAGPMQERFKPPAVPCATPCISVVAGWHPISLADIDRVMGHDPDDMDSTISRDLCAMMSVEAIFFLFGWSKSIGATAEHALAIWRGINVYYQKDGVPVVGTIDD